MQNLAKKAALAALLLGAAVVITTGAASAQNPFEVVVSSDIAISTTWTADRTYNLQGPVYVLPGATLTIQAGTVVASDTGVDGALIITRGAQIIANGTKDNPIIFTSKADVATWTADPTHPTGGDPKTGAWRESSNEWGNVTILGSAYISEDVDVIASNTAAPSASNYALMEGLVPTGPMDTRTEYGGGNDDDDSGSMTYCSLRYGGVVVDPNVELNGLSLGGIGRGTDLRHIEIMNNLDDGIEIWGGTVNLKFVSIWNIGDDSFDIDQGWRGKAQFGFVVQGFNNNASQGGGIGDNCLEMDGAEDSDQQPVTTTALYNFTVVGQPFDGDHAAAYRDNVRAQIRNSLFLDIGDRLVSFENSGGDGSGWGFGGTLDWPTTWQTAYTTTSAVNPFANPAAAYTAQTSGNLLEISGCIFKNVGSYTEAENLTGSGGVNALTLMGANSNLKEPAAPQIRGLSRDAAVIRGGKIMERVNFIDPRPINDALSFAVTPAPIDGFYSYAPYVGAFAAQENWLMGWSAAAAFGMTGAAAPAAGPGQAPSAIASMDVNCARNDNLETVDSLQNGPYYTYLDDSASLDFTFKGEAGKPILLFSGSVLNPGVAPFGPQGQADIGNAIGSFPFTDFALVANGNGPGFFDPYFRLDANGEQSLSFGQNLVPGTVINLQALMETDSGIVVKFSNAVQVIVR